MKLVSLNVNGLRSAGRKGFLDWFREIDADIVCLQEVKAQDGQLPPELAAPDGYHVYFSFAEKKGYSGVAVYAKEKPLRVSRQLGLERFDREGRLLEMKYPDFTLFNLYLPHGGRQKENLAYKLEAYDCLISRLRRLKGKNVILVGDFNVAHREIDLARPKGNADNIMFTPAERERIDRLLALDFVDSFRFRHPDDGGHYTWWPYAFRAKERNVGWRIDYALVSAGLAVKIKDASITPAISLSDHCPVMVELGQ